MGKIKKLIFRWKKVIEDLYLNYTSFDLSIWDSGHNAFYMRSDGLKLYATGLQKQTVYQFSMSVAYDISTITFDSKLSSGASANSYGVSFKPNGLKMYVLGSLNSKINEWNLSTAWDSNSYSIIPDAVYNLPTVPDQDPRVLIFNPTGLQFFTLDYGNKLIYKFTLSTAWDITSSTFTQSYNINDKTITPESFGISDDGTKLYYLEFSTTNCYVYNLSTAWDLSTAVFSFTFNSITLNVKQAIKLTGDTALFMMSSSTPSSIYKFT